MEPQELNSGFLDAEFEEIEKGQLDEDTKGWIVNVPPVIINSIKRYQNAHKDLSGVKKTREHILLAHVQKHLEELNEYAEQMESEALSQTFQ